MRTIRFGTKEGIFLFGRKETVEILIDLGHRGGNGTGGLPGIPGRRHGKDTLG
jgi:hypothetical protein